MVQKERARRGLEKEVVRLEAFKVLDEKKKKIHFRQHRGGNESNLYYIRVLESH